MLEVFAMVHQLNYSDLDHRFRINSLNDFWPRDNGQKQTHK